MIFHDTGTFSCRYATLVFERKFLYYLIQVYIPSVLVVILSWVSFWIDIDAVPARVSLGLLTVLTMTTQVSGMTSRQPRVSYIKALDVWMTACLVFVFGSLVEYCVVNVLYRREKRKEEAYRQRMSALVGVANGAFLFAQVCL
jgi:cytochrome c biogenesis factor